MELVDDALSPDACADWLARLGDSAALERLMETLVTPPVEYHRELLEHGWMMALQDGTRSVQELSALQRIADRLGVNPVQLEFWRAAWEAGERELGSCAVAIAARVLEDLGKSNVERDDLLAEGIERLPGTMDAQWSWLAEAATPMPESDLVRRLLGLSKVRRHNAFRLAQRVLDVTDTGDAKSRLDELAIGVSVRRE